MCYIFFSNYFLYIKHLFLRLFKLISIYGQFGQYFLVAQKIKINRQTAQLLEFKLLRAKKKIYMRSLVQDGPYQSLFSKTLQQCLLAHLSQMHIYIFLSKDNFRSSLFTFILVRIGPLSMKKDKIVSDLTQNNLIF